MIHRIYSPDLKTFKTLTFKPGLNILLAEKSKGASDKQTRNRAGKSSMVELIHFLLGSNVTKNSLFKNTPLANYKFSMDFDLGGYHTTVERIGNLPKKLQITSEFKEWPEEQIQLDGSRSIPNNIWRDTLGKLTFKIDNGTESNRPTFRTLFPYFARREREGGFQQPFDYFTKQSRVSQQANISYLLGLDWLLSLKWEQLRKRSNELNALKKTLKEGTFGYIIDKASTLKTQLVIKEDRAQKLKNQLATFQVTPEYHELETEASQLTKHLSDLANQNTIDRRYLAELEQAVTQETPPPPDNLEKLYKEAAIILPDLVQKRFGEAQIFHETIIKNRKLYLQSEIEATKIRITQRESQMSKLDERRSSLMKILQSTGALEHFTALQSELNQSEAELEELRQRHQTAEAIENSSLHIQQQRNHLQAKLRQDLSEHEAQINEAILTFQTISSNLYEESKAGSLTITPTENGPQFEIEIQGLKSRGVSNMQIFCFDMMLILLSLKRGQSPGFLIHDSHIFDGVDERQVGKALALGATLAEEHGFQYIVTLNTDAIPKETPAGFHIEDHTLDVKLSDSTEDGGLFGFRFK